MSQQIFTKGVLLVLLLVGLNLLRVGVMSLWSALQCVDGAHSSFWETLPLPSDALSRVLQTLIDIKYRSEYTHVQFALVEMPVPIVPAGVHSVFFRALWR